MLAAFAQVPRDVFVPVNAAERAFDDKPLPAGYSQTISQPYLVARMVELLQLKPEARVLEVGTGTGYPAAILAELAREVFSVGVIPELATTARLRLTREGYQNVHVKLGDGALGWREYAPYDAIVVTSIGARVPPALIEQLVEGGVLVMVVGPPRGRQVLIRGVKKGFKLHAKEVGELRAAPNAGRRERRRAPAIGRCAVTPAEHAPTRSGKGVRPRIRTGPKAIDDFTRACESQLLARQSLERAIVRAQSMDAIAQLLVLVQQHGDAPAELGLLAGQRLEMQQSPAAEDDGGDQRRRRDGGDGERDALAQQSDRRRSPPHAARSYTSDAPGHKSMHPRRPS